MENRANNFILKKENICGIVILYNPSKIELKNIKSYFKFIDKLYIFDNTLDKNKNRTILKNIKKYKKIQYISLNKNMGISYALNYAGKLGISEGYKWLLTMDQDSNFFQNTFENYFKDTKDLSLIGILSPNYQYEGKINEQVIDEVSEVNLVITSGNLINLEIFKKVNGFDEKLFIDEVDHEYCYKLKRNGYKILKYKNVILNHKLGKSCEKKILNIKIKFTEHNSMRKYYIFRNSIYIKKKYPEYKNVYNKKLIKEIFKILFLEKDSLKKIFSVMKAIKDSRTM